MQNLEPASSTSSSLFQLWITQWQLGILDPREASPVLKTVLVDLSTREVGGSLWECLTQFFASPAESGTSFLQDGVEPEQLMLRAWSLQPQQAKVLLEYLGRCYAFDGDDLQFWKALRKAMDLHVDAACEKSRPDFC